MIKKITSTLFLLMLCIFVSACSDSDDEKEDEVIITDQEKYAPKVVGVWIQKASANEKYIKFDFRGKDESYRVNFFTSGNSTSRYNIDKDSIIIEGFGERHASFAYTLSGDRLIMQGKINFLNDKEIKYTLKKQK